jgi:diaminohydroxyphosphoribosylaminopyrimidine deaminase/5-amino-6-(5-phosphoribosylamino)uracil reductase
LDYTKNIIPLLRRVLRRRNVLSLFVDGGARLLQSFINSNLWDEARIEIAPFALKNGVKAPILGDGVREEKTFLGAQKFLYLTKE